MGACLHINVCGVGSHDFRDQIPTRCFDFGADVANVLIESVGLAEIVTITG